MSVKLIFVVIVTVLLTVFFMQNAEMVQVNFFFSTIHLSKLALLPGLAVAGFLIGFILGRSGRSRAARRRELLYAEREQAFNERSDRHQSERHQNLPGKNLSQEDQDYLN